MEINAQSHRSMNSIKLNAILQLNHLDGTCVGGDKYKLDENPGMYKSKHIFSNRKVVILSTPYIVDQDKTVTNPADQENSIVQTRMSHTGKLIAKKGLLAVPHKSTKIAEPRKNRVN